MTSKPNRRKREAFAVLTYSNMLTLNALVQLLTEKGVVTSEEIFDRVKRFEDQAKAPRLRSGSGRLSRTCLPR
jgi:hypothetical protein